MGAEINKDKINNVIDNNSFKKRAHRQPGVENKASPKRKGTIGDWKNYLNENSKDIIKQYYGDCLIEMGYEKDYNW